MTNTIEAGAIDNVRRVRGALGAALCHLSAEHYSAAAVMLDDAAELLTDVRRVVTRRALADAVVISRGKP